MSTEFFGRAKIDKLQADRCILAGMDQTVLTLLSELPGLQAAQNALADRIAYIHKVAGVRTDGGAGRGTAQAVPAPRKAPVSKAKLEALAKARAAKAKQHQATATGNQRGKKAGAKNGGKRQDVRKGKAGPGAAANVA